MTMLTVLYFASLRDAAGVDRESVEHDGDLRSLYAALRSKHGFGWRQEQLRVAIGDAFAAWEDVPGDAAEVAFIPPVSGG